jgi:signal transduction histidine kinase
VRATALCVNMAGAAAAAWFLAGFVLDTAALHLIAILLAMLLLGRRAAALVTVGETIAFAVAADGHLNGWLPTDPQIEAAGHSLQNWATGGVMLTAGTVIVGMGISVVVRNVEAARRVAVQLAESLAVEREALRVEIGRREETQRLLVASQRREALSLLAGGVAHDFNNLLTVVYYAFEQSEREVRPGGAAAEALAFGRTAAESTAALTRQLLAYSRGDPQGKTATDLAPVVRTTATLVRRLVGKNIEMNVDVPDTLPRVECAQTQIQQVILNLAVNARDAMPDGGRPETGARPDGAAVELRVSDTGVGIEPAVAERMFEPLFSTKEAGKGTGLGLAVVATVVSDHGGTISVRGRAGGGTTFEVRLPLASRARVPAETPVPLEAAHRRLLVVDDEDAVRLVAARVLRGASYDVEAASSAEEALRAIEARGAPDVVVTDLSMPGMSGVDLARRLLGAHAALRVLLISGYAPDGDVSDLLATKRAAILVKPFTASSLVDAVETLRAP